MCPDELDAYGKAWDFIFVRLLLLHYVLSLKSNIPKVYFVMMGKF